MVGSSSTGIPTTVKVHVVHYERHINQQPHERREQDDSTGVHTQFSAKHSRKISTCVFHNNQTEKYMLNYIFRAITLILLFFL